VARLLTATWWKGSGKGTTNRTVSVALARQHSRLLLRGHPTGRVRACSGIANDARVSQTGTTSARFTGARPVTKASITTTESATLFLDKPSIADRSSGKDRMDCMRQFRAAWDRFSADQARLTEFLEMKRKRPTAGVATHLPNTGWPGERSSGGCGLARPVVPGGVSLLAVLVSAHSSVVNAATIAIITATAKSMMAVRWLFLNAKCLSDGLGPEPFSLTESDCRGLCLEESYI